MFRKLDVCKSGPTSNVVNLTRPEPKLIGMYDMMGRPLNSYIFKKNIMSKVKISTDRGDMIAELYDEATPVTVNNFLELIKKGFYNGLNFHRVIPTL
jgi:hypothetical protein